MSTNAHGRSAEGDPRPVAVPAASELLGPDHPLARAEDGLRVLREQSMLVAAVVGGSSSALVVGVPGALPLVVAATVVQLALACRLAMGAAVVRGHVLNLIIAGRGELPLRSVARERRRLLDRRHRSRLARSLEALRDEAETPLVRRPSDPPLYRRRVVAAVARELTETAEALRRPDATLCGIASSEWLLSGHDSPLYESDVRRLSEELCRIRFRLVGDAPTATHDASG